MKNSISFWATLLVAGLTSLSFADYQKVISASDVQTQLTQTHASWQAKETSMSRLSKDEVHRMLGLKYIPKGQLDFVPLHSDSHDAIDWRNVNGTNWLGPVMNQGNCGSCVAFATVATLEAQVSITTGLPWLKPTFSPEQLFECGGGTCNEGWEPDSATDFLQNSGIVDNACMPYASGSTGQDVACSAACSDSASRAYKINGATQPGSSVDAVKAALKNGPLITTLDVYADFLTYSSGVYKHVTGDEEGGHAVSIIGFDDAQRAWLIRNSWGEEWGMKGFAWVSWDDVSGVGAETWSINIDKTAPHVAITAPTDREYVSGNYQISLKVSGVNRLDTQFHLNGPNGKTMAPIGCSLSTTDGCGVELDTTQLAEGRYEIYADTTTGKGTKSQVREFYVLNSVPKMTLAMQAADGVDLTKPLNGRPEFKITATSSPVPIQDLKFEVLDKSGNVVSYKDNQYVIPEMQMGWRTISVPDGQYTIVAHGETSYQGQIYKVDSNTFSITIKN